MLGFNSKFFETYDLFKIRTRFGDYKGYSIFKKNGISIDLSNHPNESYYIDINKPNEFSHNFEDFIYGVFLTFGKCEIAPNFSELMRLQKDLLNNKILKNGQEI